MKDQIVPRTTRDEEGFTFSPDVQRVINEEAARLQKVRRVKVKVVVAEEQRGDDGMYAVKQEVFSHPRMGFSKCRRKKGNRTSHSYRMKRCVFKKR